MQGLERESQSAESLQLGLHSALNMLNIGVELFNTKSELVFTNKAAESIFGSKAWLTVVDRRIRCRPEDMADLERRIRLTAKNRGNPSDSVFHLSGTGIDDAVLFAFNPVGSADAAAQDKTHEVAGIIIDPHVGNHVDVDLFKHLYSLTDAEANIAAYLATGLDYSEIAKQRNVSISTVRSFAKSIFKKLNVNSQAGVVRKVYAATIPINPFE